MPSPEEIIKNNQAQGLVGRNCNVGGQFMDNTEQ